MQSVLPMSADQVGEVIKVLPGQTVPVDAHVIFGTSSVNEAMVCRSAHLPMLSYY